MHCACTGPTAGNMQFGLAASLRPSAKITMKSALQPLQGPLLPLAMAALEPVPKIQGDCCPPMYQAVLNIISDSGLAVLV